jgi:hypothetical protein
MPLEPADSKTRDEILHGWYPAEDWGGVIWCYMGPDKLNPPPLPRIDVLARGDGEVVLTRGDLRQYNYLNWMENFVDLGHGYVLHNLVPMVMPKELEPYRDTTLKEAWTEARHECVETHYGMKAIVVHDTGDPEKKFVNTWSTVMPTHFRFAGLTGGLPPDFTDDRREGGGMLRIIDDTHFEIFRYALLRTGNFRGSYYSRPNDRARGVSGVRQGSEPKKEYDHRKYPAWEGVPPLEDLVMQESQGEIADREHEHLALSDIGVVMLRRIWRQAMEDTANGKDPKGVVRSPSDMLEVDTFKGYVRESELKIGPQNMPSSRNGAGLIRDEGGQLVFD